MPWDDYNNAGDDSGGQLSLREIRQLLNYAREGGKIRRDNLIKACECLIRINREIVESGYYQSWKSVAFTRSRMESDLAYLVAAYRSLLSAAERAAHGVEDSPETRFFHGIDGNFRNLLKSLEKWSADFLTRLDNIPPSSAEDLAVYGRHEDAELNALIKQFESPEPVKDHVAIAEGLLKRHDDLSKTFEEMSYQKRILQHEDFMKNLIEVLDGLQRMVEGFGEFRKNHVVMGLVKAGELLAKRFESLLNKHGCYRMDLERTEFDLNLVEIVDRRHTLKTPHKHISAILSHGYVFRGKPIKIAQVQVATGTLRKK